MCHYWLDYLWLTVKFMYLLAVLDFIDCHVDSNSDLGRFLLAVLKCYRHFMCFSSGYIGPNFARTALLDSTSNRCLQIIVFYTSANKDSPNTMIDFK